MKPIKKRSTRMVMVGVCLLGAGLGGWWMYGHFYADQRSKLLLQVRQYEAGLEQREGELMAAAPVRERLSRLAATTLGSDEEGVSATLRTATNEILASQRLAETRVSTARPEPVRSPAAKASEFSSDRGAKNRPDFYVVSTTARGVGGLERVLRAMATLQAQPWVHRVDQWTITPVDKERERFELSVEFSSIYFPERDLRPARVEEGGRAWEPLSETRFTPYRSILARAVFKEPVARPRAPKPEVAVAQAPAAPAPAAPPPYSDWRLTGVMVGSTGTSLSLKNLQSGQHATLAPGESVLDATFVEATGETVTVEIAGERFLVKLGETLADRLAVAR